MLGALLLLATAGSLAAPAPADAADPAPEPAPAAKSGSSNWGPIVGGGLGVLFGSLLAAWQIRGMKRDP